MFDGDAALDQRARNEPVTMAMFVIGFAAHKGYALVFSQCEQAFDAGQVKWRDGEQGVIHFAVGEIKGAARGASAEFSAEMKVSDVVFSQYVLQRLAAEMGRVTAIRLRARVYEQIDFVPPQQGDEGFDFDIAVADAVKLHGGAQYKQRSQTKECVELTHLKTMRKRIVASAKKSI